ncbi:MAG: hypothetical protein WKG07_03500 [Hymenobacter sp.]
MKKQNYEQNASCQQPAAKPLWPPSLCRVSGRRPEHATRAGCARSTCSSGSTRWPLPRRCWPR